MRIQEFVKETEAACETCPVVMLPDHALSALSIKERAGLAFMLGAGVGLVIAKARGTDDISVPDLQNYLEKTSIRALLNQLDQ